MEGKNINKIFSENLRRWLTIRNKTQADLYKKMGVSSASVADWCTGKKMPKVDKIVMIADWLMIELTDLLEEEKRMPTEMDRLIFRLKDDLHFRSMIMDIGSFDEEKLKKVKDYVELLKK